MPFDPRVPECEFKSVPASPAQLGRLEDGLNQFLFVKPKAVSVHFSVLGLPDDPMDIPAIKSFIASLVVNHRSRRRQVTFQHRIQIMWDNCPLTLTITGSLQALPETWKLDAYISAPEQMLERAPNALAEGKWHRFFRLCSMLLKGRKKQPYSVHFEGGKRYRLELDRL
ncbi:hypothetical protein GCM10017044_10800 [Kordiimonas sediminis]|uniref:Uncharacterized protein n=1 Tax=Kordiimonas sediminis TaxID=1735581 RepID=A0A919E486_9PROT|nr:hypothetical protein [Kordiimonas sediminis]GHF18126.1 hypothetical protein GCM10017044_10800 [Kordiimonas sediminis]